MTIQDRLRAEMLERAKLSPEQIDAILRRVGKGSAECECAGAPHADTCPLAPEWRRVPEWL